MNSVDMEKRKILRHNLERCLILVYLNGIIGLEKL